VSTVNSAGTSASTAVFAAKTALPVPAAPTTLTSTSQTANSIALLWSTSQYAASYILEYKKSGDSAWTQWSSTNTTTATVTGLFADTKYDFRVLASNTAGNSGWTALNNIATPEIPLLPAPTNLRSVQTAQTVISLQWNKVEGATEYVLQRKGPGDSSFTTIYTGANAKFIDQKLTAGTTYQYQVQAIGSAFSSAVSISTANAQIDGKTVIDTPTILETKMETNGRTIISWTDLGKDYVYTVLKAGRIVVSFGDAASYVDTNPPTSGVEGYAIMAYNTVLRQYSNLVTTVAWTSAPPLEITGHEELPDGKIKLTWDAEPGMFYSVFRAGTNVSGPFISVDDFTVAGWIDENPKSSNDYMLVAIYHDGTSSSATFSNLYTVNKPAQTLASTATSLDAFWNEYALNGIEDDLFLLV
jgi:fibronectin type 3 domain-containing protein